jgi:hypothetical protein
MPRNIPEEAAKFAHVVDCVYSQLIGESPPLAWLDLTDSQRATAVAVAEAVLHGDSLESLHDLWRAAYVADGWVYGESVNCAQKVSPRLLPYADLSPEQSQKVSVMQGAVRAVAGSVGAALPALPAVPAVPAVPAAP